jgi:uncharacterized membrane protein
VKSLVLAMIVVATVTNHAEAQGQGKWDVTWLPKFKIKTSFGDEQYSFEPLNISGNGKVIVGWFKKVKDDVDVIAGCWTYDEKKKEWHPSILPLSTPNSRSGADSVNHDGTVIAGFRGNIYATCWTKEVGVYKEGAFDTKNIISRANGGISSDGKSICGYLMDGTKTAVIWTLSTPNSYQKSDHLKSKFPASPRGIGENEKGAITVVGDIAVAQDLNQPFVWFTKPLSLVEYLEEGRDGTCITNDGGFAASVGTPKPGVFTTYVFKVSAPGMTVHTIKDANCNRIVKMPGKDFRLVGRSSKDTACVCDNAVVYDLHGDFDIRYKNSHALGISADGKVVAGAAWTENEITGYVATFKGATKD